ncbi:sigma-54-dependent transcriptional regulator [Fundidesulfovibrio agrisoli]|uniref:sigma-54-dependent transcriptional regulator n=1 Tax=Fundidesulfovibrio agrisoli TaxID=2922717 RepID=UPI001FADEE2B|nr:sigma-54 dependent transcriptional regulator [Fundidesulfovibrio agrisoli]
MKTLLVIDDEPGHRLMVRAVMEDAGWRVLEAPSAEKGLELLCGSGGAGAASTERPGVVLLDMRMPGMDGMEALAAIGSCAPGLPVVMLTAYGTVGSAVEAMKRGAYDYLTKPADNEELRAVLERAHEYGRLLGENTELRRKVGEKDAAARLIGSSRGMRNLRELAGQVGPAEATVLILGESGTGKELVAELIHSQSPRRDNALIKVNCAALPDELLESELFGYAKGAFTGAVKDKPGRFQLAHGGTIFLDEVGELPLAVQAKLLRALQERVVEPLGSVRPVPTDVRILAATNRDLRAEVAKGAFREDLYFRLAVLEISIPPLRERLEDLPELVAHLLAKLGERNRKSVRSVSPAFLDLLGRYAWPGNVRELENVLERALILTRSDMLTPETLPPHLLEAAQAHAAPAAPRPGIAPPPISSQTVSPSGGAQAPASFEEAERAILLGALEANEGHRERTAEALGISRRTLQYKLKKYGLAKR